MNYSSFPRLFEEYWSRIGQFKRKFKEWCNKYNQSDDYDISKFQVSYSADYNFLNFIKSSC